MQMQRPNEQYDDREYDTLYEEEEPSSPRVTPKWLLAGFALFLVMVFAMTLFMRSRTSVKRLPPPPVPITGTSDAPLSDQDPASAPPGFEQAQRTTPRLDGDPYQPRERHRLDDSMRQASADGILHIREDYFVAQSNDIYLNIKNYLGTRIQLEGLFKAVMKDGKVYHYVIRYGPGCCEYDSTCGFEVSYGGEYPYENDWVSVTGTLDQYQEDGRDYIVLRADTLKALSERGQETVLR